MSPAAVAGRPATAYASKEELPGALQRTRPGTPGNIGTEAPLQLFYERCTKSEGTDSLCRGLTSFWAGTAFESGPRHKTVQRPCSFPVRAPRRRSLPCDHGRAQRQQPG